MADPHTTATPPTRGSGGKTVRGGNQASQTPQKGHQAHIYANEQLNQMTDGYSFQQPTDPSNVPYAPPSYLGAEWQMGYTGSPYDSQGNSGFSSAAEGYTAPGQAQSTRRKKSRSHQSNSVSAGGPAAPGAGGGPSRSSPRNHTNSASTNPRKVSATPSKQAYAGPTFHASPAASSLPIPKLFSKTASANADAQSGAQYRLDEAEEGKPSPATPELDERQPERTDRESTPLDIFFNAHRAEQARRASSGVAATQRQVSDSPEYHLLQTPTNKHQQNSSHAKSASGISSSGKEVFMMELNGGDDSQTEGEVAPTSSFNQRIQQMRNSPTPATDNTGNLNPGMNEQERKAKSEALKRLLMPAKSNSPSPQMYPSGGVVAELPDTNLHKPAPVAKQNPPMAGSAGPPGGQYNVRSMENDLRRILKMDSTEVDSS